MTTRSAGLLPAGLLFLLKRYSLIDTCFARYSLRSSINRTLSSWSLSSLFWCAACVRFISSRTGCAPLLRLEKCMRVCVVHGSSEGHKSTKCTREFDVGFIWLAACLAQAVIDIYISYYEILCIVA